MAGLIAASAPQSPGLLALRRSKSLGGAAHRHVRNSSQAVADRDTARHDRGLVDMVDIKSVGVIGAGQMGSGIAHVVALGGYDVLLHDVTPERIETGLAQIRKNMT
ncbi:MAG: 3-hydroxyacyl-CoA dehydrogenase NAD-binding domain-containing protein, partial [Phenylobacterium sp.]|nr:3-hydroxyacyl-CoA dehydrogenase NAD-binding domain-containing protein [Phenylobacterium sp.]